MRIRETIRLRHKTLLLLYFARSPWVKWFLWCFWLLRWRNHSAYNSAAVLSSESLQLVHKSNDCRQSAGVYSTEGASERLAPRDRPRPFIYRRDALEQGASGRPTAAPELFRTGPEGRYEGKQEDITCRGRWRTRLSASDLVLMVFR